MQKQENSIQKCVHYSLSLRKNQIHPHKQPLYYANAQIWSVVGERELAESISKRSSLHRSDIMAVISSLGETIGEAIASGQSVRLPYLGSFRLSIQSEGVPHKEDFTREHITHVNLRFRPGKDLDMILRQLEFVESPVKTYTIEKE